MALTLRLAWLTLRLLYRSEPQSRIFGIDRGQCIDRFYIEDFLRRRESDIRGHVLEIGDNTYTARFGGDRVTRSDVLHAAAGNPQATIVADLTEEHALAPEQFDCVICTQTLHVIYEMGAAIRSLHRSLKPGGTLLATVPGISQISRFDMDRWGDYWRLTSRSAERIFSEVFPSSHVSVQSWGNILSAVAFLEGLAVEDLRRADLEFTDPDYEVLIGIRAARPEAE